LRALKEVTSGCETNWLSLIRVFLNPSYRSDWTLDVTHPGVDAEAGWQYAQDFSASDEAWSADPPAQLERLLSGSGFMTGLGASARSHSRASSSSSATSVPASRTPTWVRRRRWVRVMRRRPDIPTLPFQGPDGAMYLPALDGSLIPFIGQGQSDSGDGEGQELGTMTSTRLSSAQDYVSRARYLVGTQRDASANGEMLSAVEARRAIAKLERATTELRQGILGKLFDVIPLCAIQSVFIHR
jgi:hypothetical protein